MKPAFRKQQGVNQLKFLHHDYDGYGTSAMGKQMASKILKGRPFGGTGFVYSKKLSHSLRPCTKYIHDRVSVMELASSRGRILLINAYLPFYDTRNIQSQVDSYKETIAFIENIMQVNSDCSFIVLMDMNCNLYNPNHTYSKIIREFMNSHDLIAALDLTPSFDHSTAFTRCDVKTNSYTLIDGILLSRGLSDMVTSANIVHYGNNVSDHSPVEVVLNIDLDLFKPEKLNHSEYIPWSNLSVNDRTQFSDKMEYELKRINVPYHSILHGNKSCHDVNHISLLEKYYNDIVNAVRVADSFLPRKKHGLAKSFWSDELTYLKRQSMDAFILWKNAGSPKSGPIFMEKNHAHSQYKRALRWSKRDHEHGISDNLSHNLLSYDSKRFWQNWNKLESKHCNVTCVDGKIGDENIANTFAKTFSKVYDGSENISLKQQFQTLYSQYCDSHAEDDISPYFISWSEFLVCISKVKTGKATGSFVKPQHLLYGSPLLSVHLHFLFNGLIQHEYVPHDFLHTTVTPIIKDTAASHSDSSNYRPITLSCLFSQLFESAISLKVSHLLWTDDLQFGFKPKHSTAHALYVLNETVDYFTSHGSSVFSCFLDCSKAFDKVPHCGLFKKLIERNIPLCILNILIYWLSNLTSQCRWNSAISESYAITSGVKQGGILSPFLFNVFMNDLLILLRKQGVGCFVKNIFVGAIMYADDLALIAPSRHAMQTLLSVCQRYCHDHSLSFNTKKSKAIIFGSKADSCNTASLLLNGEPIEYIHEWKYLGCQIVGGKEFSFSSRKDLSSFRCSANSVLNAIRKPSDPVSMMLLYSFSVPILTYASEVKRYPCSEMRACQVALNDSIRKIFTYNRWESVRALRSNFGYHDLYTLFELRRRTFFAKIPTMGNAVVNLLRTFTSVTY